MTFPRYILVLSTQIRSSADTTTSAVKKVRFMKLYKNLTLMVLFGMTLVMLGVAAAANATAIDPGVGLRGDGASVPVGPAFSGGFQTTAPEFAPFQCATTAVDGSPTGDGSNTNCFQNVSTFTFVALTLTFDNTLLSYACDNSQDPFFTSCRNDPTNHAVTFYGLGSLDYAAYVGGSGNACDGACLGIPSGDLGHFLIALETADFTGPDTTDMTGYTAVADLPVGSTPEPASALLFVIAMGAIALFLKRA
jgi:hypothetical protein